MIGSFFADHPDILMHSFTNMNEGYGKRSKPLSPLLKTLIGIYIRVFGIPEIGFQVRSMYFLTALRRIRETRALMRILDVGSGIGSYVFTLSRMFPDAQVDGWEIDRKKLLFTQKFSKELHISNANFSYSDITDIPSKRGVYDLIVNIDVLEHIKDYKKALGNMHAMLAPGGFLYLHTPKVGQKRFFKRFEAWEHEDHVREGFDPTTLRKDLQNVGFSDISITHTFGPIGALTWELNHLLLSKSFFLAGMCYPLLFVVSRLDGWIHNSDGLCLSVVARKKDHV